MSARRAGLCFAVIAGIVLASLAGCSSPSSGGPRFVVAANPTGVWEPERISLEGFPAGQRVTIAASTRVGGGWSSQAVYAVPPDGDVDLAHQAPVEAPFAGADPMGLFWTMRSAHGAAATSDETWGGATLTVDLTATVGGLRVAAASVQRVGLTAAAPSRVVSEDGLSGDFFAPVRQTDGLRPAVLVLDGTDPGTPTGVLEAATLSAMGYPALALSTYGSAGQLEPRRTVPAERLLTAVDWLMAQPGVDDQRIFVMGTSRGAQLALWLAVAHPGLVYGAIAPGGTTGLVCPSPVPSPAITVGGAWVPCVTGTDHVEAASVLDLGRIRGPLVLGCADRDEQLANGCAWMDEAARLRPARPGDSYVRAVGASHLFYTPPFTPLYLPADATAQSTERGRDTVWRAIVTALTAPSTVPGR
ncbi:acyl-CoA thioesterase/bile acid-CoA:amino acid N-acyltransferase family protein [Leifsonia aquatica]|uniref:acyl-CoA thioesterase/bile acid-CoA:amino acid N-acyltransferase family protein n=1 Tax=Leifsonia aquatica TaxID=144185 RepID=UPI000A832CF4|nr:acyl-CoA thioesterase/bile acid-CoA:amino acid N-acyltransferase family protein [Leifsonia aquatica]